MYGPSTEGSDIDFGCLMPYASAINGYVASSGVSVIESEYFNSFKFRLAGFFINVIPLWALDFMAWHQATQAMKLCDPITDKNWRCIVFQQFVQAFKAADMKLGKSTNEQAYLHLYANPGSSLDTIGDVIDAINHRKELPF